MRVILAALAIALPFAAHAKVTISAEAMKAHTRILSDDSFEGRAPATPGEDKTIAYISDQMKKAGLVPANNGSWFQDVPTVEITVDPKMQLIISGKTNLNLSYGDQMVLTTKHQQPMVSITNAELVFVGYGVNAPEANWNDYAGIDMRGKIAVVMVNDPGFSINDKTLFGGKEMTYYGRWTYKYEEAMRQGAAGVLILHDTVAASYPWAVVFNSWGGPQLDIDNASENAKRATFEGWVSAESAQKLFAGAGLDYAQLQRAASVRGFKAIPMGLFGSASASTTIRKAQSRNVVGVLKGSKGNGETLMVTAHWDHLGRCPADPDGDDICNGAVDNASGISGLLAMAEALGKAKIKPQRDIVFAAWTLEESGLLGSGWYAEHPLVPLHKTVAGVNMDALNLYGRSKNVVVIGAGKSELEVILARHTKAQGRVIEREDKPEAGYFFRSDHFPLAKVGVPMLYADGGTDLLGKPAGTGKKLADAYTATSYHKPSDEYSDALNFEGAAEDVTLFARVVGELANSKTWPNWLPSTEFRAARDASLKLQK
jgi:Zn-dependent M28 family amino/carboxypeptidase